MLNDAYRTLKDPIKRTQYLLHLEGVELEEQSKSATEKARATGEVKKQIVPPDLLEEVFELNMHLEELRMNKKVGDDDPALFEEIGKAKLSLEAKHEALLHELQTYWKDWDGLIDRGQDASTDRARAGARQDGGRAEPPQLHPQSGSGCERGAGELKDWVIGRLGDR